MWSEKTWIWCKIIFWIVGITFVKVQIRPILFPELFTWVSSDTGSESYWCSKAIKIKKNVSIMLSISFILHFHPLWHVMGFSISHHIIQTIKRGYFQESSVAGKWYPSLRAFLQHEQEKQNNGLYNNFIWTYILVRILWAGMMEWIFKVLFPDFVWRVCRNFYILVILYWYGGN